MRKKLYSFFILIIAVAGLSAGASAQNNTAGEKSVYKGELNISLGTTAMDPVNATIEITDNGNGTCDFLLPQLSVALFPGGTPMDLGAIKLEKVAMTQCDAEDHVSCTSYSGSTTGLELLGGLIVADEVVLSGETNEKGAADFLIKVKASTLDVTVTFKGQKDETAGISDIANDMVKESIAGAEGCIMLSGVEGRVLVYSIDGRVAKSAIVSGDTRLDLNQGLYVVKTERSTKKVIVK